MRASVRLLLFCLAFQACQATASELRFVTEDFPPFSYPAKESSGSRETSPAAGPLVEVVQAVCNRLRYRCSIELHPWRRALDLAERGEADGIFTVAQSPRREAYFHITRMLVTSRYAVFARDHHVFTRAQDLAGRMVGVYGPSGTSYILSQRLEGVPDVEVRLVADNRRLLRMLDSGRFGPDGLVVINQDVAWHLIDDEQLSTVREAGELASVSYGIGLSRKSVEPEHFRLFEQATEALMSDGTIPAILRRHQLQPAQ
nr:transporter substrate-binding domain-containing protein [Pseudomonas sp.]